MNKKTAKMEMLKELSKEMSDDQYNPLKDMLKGKKLQKVTVMSDSPEGLKKGLSKAEQIMKAKGLMKDEEMEHECPMCEGEGCEECSEESEDSEQSDEEMSPEKMKEMIKMLKEKLGEE